MNDRVELIIAGAGLIGAGAGSVAFLWQLFRATDDRINDMSMSTDRRIDSIEKNQIELITLVEGHIEDSKEFHHKVQEWRDADRELTQSKFELHWESLQNLKEMIVRLGDRR